MYCKYCGSELPEGSVFCLNCGRPIKRKANNNKGKKKVILIVIVIVFLLGIAGNVAQYMEQNPVIVKDITEDNGKNTIMIYMDGADIESGESRAVYGCMTDSIRDALSCGIDTEKNNVLIYTGGCEKWHDFDISSEQDSIYKIENGNLVLLELSDPKSMSDPQTLEYFMSYCTDNYPAERYSLILADHGGGPNKGVCVDKDTNDIISIAELSRALKRAGFVEDNKLENIIFDACLMASLEVAATMKEHARYMCASENVSLSAGTDYTFLSAFNNEDDTEAVGKEFVDKFYRESYEEYKQYFGCFDVTFSCIDLAEIDKVIECSDAFFEVAKNDMKEMYSIFSLIRQNTKSVYDTGGDPNVPNQYFYDLVDLYDFVSKHKTTYKDEAQALMQALDSAVVHNYSTSDSMHGLTFYFPFKSELDSTYSNVCFSSGYSDYISAYVKEKNGTTSYDNLFSSIKPNVSAQTDKSQISMSLTSEQVEDFLYGEYYVFAKPYNIDEEAGGKKALADDEYMFVSNGFDVTLNGNELVAKINNKGCYVSSDGDDLLCSLYAMQEGNKTIYYTPVSLFYVPTVEGEGDQQIESLVESVENMRMDVGKMYLDISGDSVKRGSLYLMTDKNNYQRSPLTVDYYDDIQFNGYVKQATRDKNSKILPFNQWQVLTDKTLSHTHKTTDISMKMKPFDQNADYYAMIVAHDIYGNKNCSDIVPLK